MAGSLIRVETTRSLASDTKDEEQEEEARGNTEHPSFKTFSLAWVDEG
jgi:hypothetical protein